jgi:hypothetical protein
MPFFSKRPLFPRFMPIFYQIIEPETVDIYGGGHRPAYFSCFSLAGRLG